MARNLRKFTLLGDVKYRDVNTLTNHGEEDVQAGQLRQAPTGVSVIGRLMDLMSGFHKDGGRVRIKDAAWQASEELSEFWVFGMNVYPLAVSAIVVRMLKDHSEFVKLMD